VWSRIGDTLGRFHREGVFHADLNAHNVLLDADEAVWLIDFDRGALRASGTEWKRANLSRLFRSLQKIGATDAAQWARARELLLAAYRRHDDGIERAVA
jgi:3-deoxy-D-manno-octulosonic acid kinase